MSTVSIFFLQADNEYSFVSKRRSDQYNALIIQDRKQTLIVISDCV